MLEDMLSSKHRRLRFEWLLTCASTELYTDESPGLKVDPVVVLVLSLVFIFSVVALHSKLSLQLSSIVYKLIMLYSHRQDHPQVLQLS